MQAVGGPTTIELPPAEAQAQGLAKLKVRRSVIPAVTHVDQSARIQTVDETCGLYRKLLEAFDRKTGCPVIVNTSFNLGWDPIVCTPQEAYETFMSADFDMLCMGHFLLEKQAQPAWVGDGAGPRDAGSASAAADPVLDPLLQSPCCGAGLERRGEIWACAGCGHEFGSDGGIAQLFWPHEKFDDPRDVTRKVQGFYEETAFPNYDA